MATFSNQATLTYTGGTANSNIVTGELLETLTTNKTASSDTYAPGDEITYVVNLINSGNTTLGPLTLVDDLGSYEAGGQTYVPLTYVAGSARYYVNGVPAANPTVTDTDPLTITTLSVPAGGNAALLYRATLNEFAAPGVGGTVVNTASVTGGGLTTPVTADATVTASGSPRLTIAKSLNPITVVDNDRLTYTFVIENSGNTEATAADNIVLSDTFDPILSDIVVTVNGQTLDAGSYTYDQNTGVFSTTAGALTVPAATYTQTPTGQFVVTPGVTTVQITGTV